MTVKIEKTSAGDRTVAALFILIPAIQIFVFGGLIFILIFYFAPHQIVLGTYASLFAITAPIILKVSPYLRPAWDLRPTYFRLITAYTVPVFLISLLAAMLLVLWSVSMFGEIRQRYIYLDAIDRAVKIVEDDQIAIPPPLLLAAAFQQMPYRPEVPFIIARSVRLLSPDDKLDAFLGYMRDFVAALDRDKIIETKTPESEIRRLSVEQSPSIPILDPIELIIQYTIEVPENQQNESYAWAIKTLKTATAARTDERLEIYSEILQIYEKLNLDTSKPDPIAVMDDGIKKLSTLIDKLLRNNGGQPNRLVADQIYQDALDSLGELHLRRAIAAAPAPDQCDNGSVDAAIETFSRLMILRRRLMTANEILWWRPPNKLTLYNIFSELSGQHSSVGSELMEQLKTKCSYGFQQINKLYTAAAFKTFQDPEQWVIGTPLASAYNGSAASAQLRKWLQQGW